MAASKSITPVVPTQPLTVDEILEVVHRTERELFEALRAHEAARLESLRTACAVLWGVEHAN